jgi:hypothetical protein
MECDQRSGSRKTSASNAEDIAASPASQEQSAPSSPDARDPEPEEKTKQKKHSRVHKREKELYGLITPAFLPLLDARDSSPEKKKKRPKPETAQHTNNTANTEQAGAARDAEKSTDGRKSRKDHKDMEHTAFGEPGRENQQPDAAKKPKRTTMKKSALRHKDTPRTRRKRVSLQIDGQTVLPADTVIEPPLTSPSSATTSASNSTTSLDDMIDPRLTQEDGPVYIEHRDAVHHSLPLPMSNAIHSPTKPLAETPISIAASNSPPSPRSQSIPFGSVQHTTRTFLDPSPGQHHPSIPETAGPEPIHSTSRATSAELEIDDLTDEDQGFDTYVGGLLGSGVDDVDQAGSYGYPSSLGASYMESYMQNRPLSVRMQAADKAGLDNEEKRKLLEEKDEEGEEDSWIESSARGRTPPKDTDDDNFMGDMEGFE